MENEKLPNCCGQKKEYVGNNSLMGIAYGIIPHIGCIIFIIGAVLGATILMQFFRPLLMNRYIFHYLILISAGFATLSSVLYLKKNKALSLGGVKKKKKYLLIMYSSTIGVNILLFFFIFPYLANVTGKVSAAEITGASVLSISVDIPCSGHAPLITNELKTIGGVKGSKYSFPNKFEVYYDSSQTSEQEILSLEVFDEYPASIIEKEKGKSNQEETYQSCCGGTGCSSEKTGVCGCG